MTGACVCHYEKVITAGAPAFSTEILLRPGSSQLREAVVPGQRE